MLKRYSKDPMVTLWSEENKFRYWLIIEIAVLRARRRIKEIPYKIPCDLETGIVIDPVEIDRIERNTGHDVVAFLEHVYPQFPRELQPWLHRGMTSYDVVDTALSLQLRDSTGVLREALIGLMENIKTIACGYKYEPEVGRTHGIHAEPITFGVKLANWYSELKRNMYRLHRLQNTVSVGKLSGAVGMYTLDPRVEEMVCQKLGLAPIIATQIISRDIIAEYMSTLGIVAASIGKIAINLRLLSQTEIREIMEPFGEKQKGSSAMPHKKNPIGSENIAGLMRTVCANVQVAYDNLMSCWHERSLDNSSSERVILADSSVYLHYAIIRLTGIIKKMRIFPAKMLNNLNLTKGLIFSQEVMMLVAEKSGLPREEAHTLVRDVALKCWEDETNFCKALLGNQDIMRFVNEEELRACFNLERKLRYVNYIFNNVFGKNH